MRDNWQTARLGDLCTIKGRIGFRGYTRQDLVEKGEGAITLSPSNIVDDKLNLDKCQYISWFKYDESPEIMIFEGDIIYAKTASIGKVALVKGLPEKATINPQFVVFKNIKCNRSFLYYAVRSNSFKEQVSLITNGVAIPTVSQSNLEKLQIKLPSDSEQRRIVDEMDLLSSIIDKKKVQLRELDTLAQSIFYEMFGNPVENEKGWNEKKLGDVCVIERGGSPRPIDSFITEDAGGVSWIKIGDATEGGMVINSTKQRITQEGAKKSRFVHKGDFLLSNSMSFGKPYILGIDGCIHDGWLVIRDNNCTFNKIYLYYYLGCPQTYDAFKGMAVGGVVNNLNKDMVKGVKVAIPNMGLQESFAEKISSIELQKDTINRSITESQKLFDYTMDKYFG